MSCSILPSLLAAAENYGPVTSIKVPKGHLEEALADLSEHPDLADLATEADDDRMHVEAGGVWWFYGGLV